MRAYSLDLGQKVVGAVECGDSTIEEVAASFGDGQTFVRRSANGARNINTGVFLKGI